MELRLPSLLRPALAPSADDEAAFQTFALALTAHLGVLGASLMIAAALLWWPLDPWVLGGTVHEAAFGRMRVSILATLGIGLVSILGLTRGLTRPVRAVRPLGVLVYAAMVLSVGEALGTLGHDGVDRGQLTWLADAWMGAIPLAFMPLRFRWRVPATLLVVCALAGGFFLPHPGNLQVPGAWAQVSFGAFAGVFSLVVGEATTRVTRRSFFERQALDRANQALAHLTSTLSDQVAERTATLQALTHHLAESQEAERHRLAHDLHDDLGQQLAAMRYTVARLAARVDDDPDTAPLVADLSALLEGTSRATRSVVTRLRPRILDDLGLRPALEWLCEDIEQRAGHPCTLHVHRAWSALPAHVELALFRMVQEATTNALKHGSPSRMDVHVDAQADRITVSVFDDGTGFDPVLPRGGLGLVGIEERIRALQGTFRVDTAPGHGVRLIATVPLPAEEAPP